MDTTRADHTSAYGYRHPTTPALEALAREGTLFEVAYAPVASTGPTHASLFTGKYPSKLGYLKNGLQLGRQFVTLAEVLRDEGYQTAAIVSSFAIHGQFGFEQGSDYYHDDFVGGKGESRVAQWAGKTVRGDEFDKDAEVASAQAIEWLANLQNKQNEQNEGRPFFLWLHYFDPHWPYEARDGREKLFPPESASPSELDLAIAHYDGEIREVDEAIASVLAQLERSGLDADTLVRITGDHGEGLEQHGWMQHGLQIYEESVRVPLILRLPKRIPAGRRVRDPVSIVDLMPTILSVLQIRLDGVEFDGLDISPMWSKDGPGVPPRSLFLQRRHYTASEVGGHTVRGEKVAIRRGSWKYIEAAQERSFELFDLDEDPGETNNLFEAMPREAETLASQLRDWRARSSSSGFAETVDPEAAAALKALGYVQ
ncbi:MAG: sulfatase [Deltaproteobacteria bacterium]|nr:sulfatase [Deltaproteobacteria bacterium]